MTHDVFRRLGRSGEKVAVQNECLARNVLTDAVEGLEDGIGKDREGKMTTQRPNIRQRVEMNAQGKGPD